MIYPWKKVSLVMEQKPMAPGASSVVLIWAAYTVLKGSLELTKYTAYIAKRKNELALAAFTLGVLGLCPLWSPHS